MWFMTADKWRFDADLKHNQRIQHYLRQSREYYFRKAAIIISGRLLFECKEWHFVKQVLKLEIRHFISLRTKSESPNWDIRVEEKLFVIWNIDLF